MCGILSLACFTHSVYMVCGETLSNVNKILVHPDEDILSNGGILEATLLSRHLSDVDFTKAYCSDYPRTVHTATIILEGSKNSSNLEIIKDAQLREIGLDSQFGKSAGEAMKTVVSYLESGRPINDFSFPNSETVASVKTRAKSFFKGLCQGIDQSKQTETVLVVSHGAYIKCLLDYLREADDINILNWDDKSGCGRIMKNATYMKLFIGKNEQNSPRSVEFQEIHANSHLSSIPGVDSLTRMVKTPEWAPLSGCFQV